MLGNIHVNDKGNSGHSIKSVWIKVVRYKHVFMKLNYLHIAFLIILSLEARAEKEERRVMQDLYTYNILKAGEIQPKGWLKSQLEKDLIEGYIGHFDEVHHTVTHDVFIKQDRKSNKRYSIIKEWWSGEHEGYWKDAVIRMAFLTGNEKYKKKAQQWMDELIKHAGDNGYIGIYDDCERPNCRFNHTRGNGELWTTSRILMAMLAYYEFTNDSAVLNAAVEAADLIITQYSGKNYFSVKGRGGGVSHGIGFFENLEWLYRITDDKKYLDFSKKLYDDFNQGVVRDDDLKIEHLLDKDRHFRKHGAHIAEGLFVPAFIATQVSNNLVYDEAAKRALEKLDYHLTPGGAMRSDEWIKGRMGTADERYEYCSIAEMVSPMNKIISFQGKLSLADKIETMVFNAGQGARFPTLTALSYLTSDNRININHAEIGKRESYDAAHRAAACCVLNGGRLLPYFVEGMWMKNDKENEIVAMLYGPCEVSTKLNGTNVNIIEETKYPFSDKVKLKVQPHKKTAFKLVLRKPHGTERMKVSVKGADIEEFSEKYVIYKEWGRGDQVSIDFDFNIKYIPQPASKTVPDSGIYLKRGALVYALPFEHEIDTVKEYKNSGFYRYRIKAEKKDNWTLGYRPETRFNYTGNTHGTINDPWGQVHVELTGNLANEDGEIIPVSLVPIGNTIFRRVTFPIYKP